MRTPVPKTLWQIFGLIVLLAFGRLLLDRATTELLIFFTAIVLAEGIRPLVKLLGKAKIPRALGVLIVFVLFFGIMYGLGYLIVTPVVAQFASLIDHFPEIQSRVSEFIDKNQYIFQNPQARAIIKQLPSRIESIVSNQASLLVTAPLALAAIVTNGVFLLLFMFFWTMATDVMKTFTLSFFRDDRKAWAEEIIADLSTKTGGYVRGVAINMVVIAILSGIGLFFLGVPYMLLLAIVAGITEAIPIVGPVLGGAVAAIVALFTLGWVKAVQVAILYLVIQQIESNTLVPFVMNRVVALNPLAIIVALVLGTALLGIPGAILAVPAVRPSSRSSSCV